MLKGNDRLKNSVKFFFLILKVILKNRETYKALFLF